MPRPTQVPTLGHWIWPITSNAPMVMPPGTEAGGVKVTVDHEVPPSLVAAEVPAHPAPGRRTLRERAEGCGQHRLEEPLGRQRVPGAGE
jgi:hypothetical protein